jgi:protein-S-isoprenylcysteine O-methyltransferase Ste14
MTPELANDPDVARPDATRGPGVSFPPMLIFAVAFMVAAAANTGLDLVTPGAGVRPVQAAGLLLILAGAGAFIWGLATFARARTGIMLWTPARRLITDGPYKWSRNPMYVGCVAVYVGAALAFGVYVALLLLPLVIALVTILVIRREERYMEMTFGSEYLAYRRQVSRWL